MTESVSAAAPTAPNTAFSSAEKLSSYKVDSGLSVWQAPVVFLHVVRPEGPDLTNFRLSVFVLLPDCCV